MMFGLIYLKLNSLTKLKRKFLKKIGKNCLKLSLKLCFLIFETS